MSHREVDTDLVILGAGPGGYAAAFHAAEAGRRVVLVDESPTAGGVCLHRGCIPSKALLHIAAVLNETREAGDFGVTFAAPELDVDRMRAWKNNIITSLTNNLAQQVKRLKIEYLQGRGRFAGPRKLDVALADGETVTVRFENAILATGSRPAMIPGLPENSELVWDSTDALRLDLVPKTLLVIGGGYIGLELGTAYDALGSEVSVVEMMPGLLPGADNDLVSVLKRRLSKRLAAIKLRTKVSAVSEDGDGLAVTFVDAKGNETTETFERVLVSVGRRPNSEDLGLENTAIKLDERGFVPVDPQRRTAEPGIFAIGDVTGDPGLAHKAHAESIVAVETILGHDADFAPAAIPGVVFTDPEIAWCGLTETEAKNLNIPFDSAKVPWRGNGRTLSLNRDDGMSKVIADPETRQILGVGLVGPGAGELIAAAVIAMEKNATVDELAHAIHPHPTLSETVMEAAAALCAKLGR